MFLSLDLEKFFPKKNRLKVVRLCRLDPGWVQAQLRLLATRLWDGLLILAIEFFVLFLLSGFPHRSDFFSQVHILLVRAYTLQKSPSTHGLIEYRDFLKLNASPRELHQAQARGAEPSLNPRLPFF